MTAYWRKFRLEKYDLIIIGAGPAGLSAAVYAARYKLNTLILSKSMGGMAAVAHKVCNFPSYTEIKGFDLMQKCLKQVEELKVPIIYDEVLKIEKDKKNFSVFTEKKKYNCKKIIFAGGCERIRLKVNGEGKFLGRGVSYCATCDAAFFKNKIVCVVGGSDAALTAALLLSEYASKVYIIYRKEKFFRSEPAWIELVEKEKKIETIFNEEVIEIIGKDSVEEVKLKSGKLLKTQGIFIEIGSVPETESLNSLNVKKTENGYILTDKTQKTNIDGLYAAGDVIDSQLKQIVTAASQGAIAAYSVYQDIKREE
ncbi:MAG: FAD-dependent oxidoreductase [Candidatus Nanoarchaeia archaeon]|nr:FAD-dependent oxidoreductase [Candidatus Nanoarchaeia archaeon]